MQRVYRPLAVFGIAAAVTLTAALQLWWGGARGGDVGGIHAGSAFFPGYDLAKLQIAEPSLYHVSQSYVDPARVDWERMYVAALDAVERRVPGVMFGREQGGSVVTVEIDDFRTVLEVPAIGDDERLLSELRRVAALLAQHLEPASVPMDDHSTDDPLATVEYALVNGMLATLDPHSVLLPPDDAREMDVENHGEFGGLGITLVVDPKDGRLMVQYPIRDTPAHTAGLRCNDHIVRIDGESTVNMSLDDAVTRLRGPVGAQVSLEIERAGSDEPFTVAVERQLIGINPVWATVLDGGIGYVRIQGFHEQVERDLGDALTRMRRDAGGELAGLVLDLRDNPGGYLNQAVKVADTFLDEGEIVSQIDGGGRRTDAEVARKASEPLYPLAVLVNANSASASEIVAGALRYNERAVIVGERTFGKGSVQNLHPFYDDSKLKLTISKYLTPGDRSIQSHGIPADIELDPAFVPPGDDDVRLFARERVRREADLENALEPAEVWFGDPAFHVRYLHEAHGEPRCSDEPDVHGDPQIGLARDVLKAASGWRRSDVLASAAPVIARHQRIGQDAVGAAFAARGIDWSNGPAVTPGAALPVEVTLDLGEDGRVAAGAPERIALEVTNRTDRPIFRVVGVVTDNEVLEGREFWFGRIDPGATRRAEVEVSLPAGWAAERAPLAVEFRDAADAPFGEWRAELPVVGRALPAFAWTWRLSDAKGDGDGVLDAGESVELVLEVENVGEGAPVEPFARLRNRSRRAIDLVVASLEPAAAPGERWSGAFAFDVKAAPEDGAPLEVELSLGDAAAYDHATIAKAGFVEWYGERERITMTVGEPFPAGERRLPPDIEITRAPELRVANGRATLSGAVTDERGIGEVLVFVGDDKVFFESAGAGAPIRRLPFTADMELAPGPNVITVLATDDQGFVASRAVVAWSGEPAPLAAKVE